MGKVQQSLFPTAFSSLKRCAQQPSIKNFKSPSIKVKRNKWCSHNVYFVCHLLKPFHGSKCHFSPRLSHIRCRALRRNPILLRPAGFTRPHPALSCSPVHFTQQHTGLLRRVPPKPALPIGNDLSTSILAAGSISISFYQCFPSAAS